VDDGVTAVERSRATGSAEQRCRYATTSRHGRFVSRYRRAFASKDGAADFCSGDFAMPKACSATLLQSVHAQGKRGARGEGNVGALAGSKFVIACGGDHGRIVRGQFRRREEDPACR